MVAIEGLSIHGHPWLFHGHYFIVNLVSGFRLRTADGTELARPLPFS